MAPIAPPDLEIRVTVETKGSETYLTYLLHSSSDRRSGFHYHTIHGRPIKARPQDYQTALLKEIGGLNKGFHADGSSALREEIPADLAALGRKLYRELFPPEMRTAYRTFRKEVRTLLITSDEPWIPWELVKPYDDEAPELIDDDFLCAQFQLTRWLGGGLAPASFIGVERLACIEAGSALPKSLLPNAKKELQWLQEFAQRHSEVNDHSLPDATYPQVRNSLEEGGLDLLHFVGHGQFGSADPDQSTFHLVNDRPLRPLDLYGEVQTRTKARRPLVFLNACQIAQQGFSLTGLGGWAPQWVGGCGCGAFIAPLWAVNDRLAHDFAIAFYSALENGHTFGQATEAARQRVRDLDPSRPTWLAFTAYAHPNGRLLFGRSQTQTNGNHISASPTIQPSTTDRSDIDRAIDRAPLDGQHFPSSTAGWGRRKLKLRELGLAAILLVMLGLAWSPRLYTPKLDEFTVYSGQKASAIGTHPEDLSAIVEEGSPRARIQIRLEQKTPLSHGTLERELHRSFEASLTKSMPSPAQTHVCRIDLNFESSSVSKPAEMFSCAFEASYRLHVGTELIEENPLYEIKKAFTERAACIAAVRNIGTRMGDRVRELC